MSYLFITTFALLAWWRSVLCGRSVDDIPTEMKIGHIRTIYKCGKTPFATFKSFIHVIGISGTVKNIHFDHAISLVQHCIVSCLIHWCLGGNQISLLAAILFAIHPVNNQGVAWCNGKRYAQNTALTLLMYRFVPVGILIYFFIPFVQANAILAPVLLLFKGFWQIVLITPLIGLLGYKRLKVWYEGRAVPLRKDGVYFSNDPRKIISFFKLFSFYFWHCLVPHNYGFFYGYGFYYTSKKSAADKMYKIDAEFFAGIVTFLAVAVATYMNIHNAIGFGLFWFILFISQYCGFRVISQLIADRFCYLPNVGLQFAVAGVLVKFCVVPYIFPFLIALYIVQSWIVVRQFDSMEAIHDYNIHYHPTCPKSYLYKHIKLSNEVNVVKALYWIQRVTDTLPNDGYGWYLYAVCLMNIHRDKESLDCFKKAVERMEPYQYNKEERNIINFINMINERNKK